MKSVTFQLLLFFVVFSGGNLLAQNVAKPAPLAFKNFPASAKVSLGAFDKTLATKAGQTIKLNLTPDLAFEGQVLSSLEKFGKLLTITAVSPAWQDAVLTLSRIRNDDNTFTYKGQLISKDYSEGFSIKRNDDNSYSLVRLNMTDLLQDR